MENTKKEGDWKKKLTAEQYRVMREKGTEAPFTGKYVETKIKGMYKCVACGNELFSSSAKFDSGTGWPSFDDVVASDKVSLSRDSSLGMDRVEVSCAKCGAHLGHVFSDGPTRTGKRYCINSVCLDLDQDKK